MTHASTGAGRVVADSNVPVGGVRAQLTNFDIDVDALKPEHLAFLSGSVVPVLVAGDARIWLQGQASHTGTHAHNMDLSHRRALRVVEFLRSRGVAESRTQVDWVGDSLAGPSRREFDGARAVALLAAPLGTLRPPAPVPAPPARTLPTGSMFKIRILGALSAGVGRVNVERVFVQIWDALHSVTSFYLYQSGGLGRGLGASVSATLSGPWNDFSTTGPLSVDQFGGAARFTTAGAGPWTVNYLNIMGLPPGVATRPNPLKLTTGFTMGLGASTSVGQMVRGFTGPFTGP